MDLDNGVWGMPRIVGLNLFKCYGSKLELDVTGVDVQVGPARRLRYQAGWGDEFLGPPKVFFIIPDLLSRMALLSKYYTV